MDDSSYQLLPEWHPQRAILVSWPYSSDALSAVYSAMIKVVAMTQSVMVLCQDAAHRAHAQRSLIEANVNLPRVRFFIIPSDTIWMRDYGPITLKGGQNLKILNFQAIGRGNPRSVIRDNQVCGELFDQNFLPQADFETVKFVLEGSSIETDGAGALLMGTQYLLSERRNPNCSQGEAERILKQTLGVQRILWLEQNNPVDSSVRFVNARTICYVPEARLEEQLKGFRDNEGRPYELIPLPVPQQALGSYAHFVMTNQTILVPFYDDPCDLIAKNMLQSCFPQREIIGIPCRPLIENEGNLHGITMQIPV